MENNPSVKGNSLERAVEFIEKTILATNPSLRGAKFEIETKKKVNNGGARYEIDLFVQIDQGFGYKSIFIFECKNWEAKVSRNEITEFSEKIKITKAQKGFFIAKGYTSDAEARAKQDNIDLLYVDDNPIDLSFPQFDFFNKINKIIAIEVRGFGVIDDLKTNREVIDWENCIVKYKDRDGKFKDFITLLTEEMASEIMKDDKLNNLVTGKHSFESEKEFLFQKGELFIKEPSLYREIEKVKIKVVFETELIRPKVVFRIDVLTRGRFIEYEAVKTSTGGEVKFEMVTINRGKETD